jgi:hypothetical protein
MHSSVASFLPHTQSEAQYKLCLYGTPRLCRLIVQSLPLMLVCGISIVVTATRLLQLVQTHVLHVLPFGSLGQLSILDVCAGIFVSGLFMMYFGANALCFLTSCNAIASDPCTYCISRS